MATTDAVVGGEGSQLPPPSPPFLGTTGLALTLTTLSGKQIHMRRREKRERERDGEGRGTGGVVARHSPFHAAEVELL